MYILTIFEFITSLNNNLLLVDTTYFISLLLNSFRTAPHLKLIRGNNVLEKRIEDVRFSGHTWARYGVRESRPLPERIRRALRLPLTEIHGDRAAL